MDSVHDIKEHHLILIGLSTTKAFELNADTVTLGRSKSSGIPIDSDLISRTHATFLRTFNAESQSFNYRIIDGSSDNNPSKNGILVNDERCLVHLLEHGDILSFSNSINGVYLKVELNDERFKKYLSMILECNTIDQKECHEINLITKIFCEKKSYLSENDPTSIMMGGPSN